jgi:hypothetical protein
MGFEFTIYGFYLLLLRHGFFIDFEPVIWLIGSLLWLNFGIELISGSLYLALSLKIDWWIDFYDSVYAENLADLFYGAGLK